MRDRDITTRKHHFHHFLLLSLSLSGRGNASYDPGREAENFTWQLCSLCWKDYSSLPFVYIFQFPFVTSEAEVWDLILALKLISRVVPSWSNSSLSLSLSRAKRGGWREESRRWFAHPVFFFFWKTMFLSASGKMGETRGNKVKRQRP